MSINFEDPQTWVAISFILFFVLFGKVIWKKLSNFLDDKINVIQKEIKDAQDLHNEAKILLENEKKKVQDLENKVKSILEESKRTSQSILIENKDIIEKEINKLEKECEEKIKYLEKEAVREIREKVTNRSIDMAIKNIQNNLSDENHHSIMKSSITDIKKELEKGKIA